MFVDGRVVVIVGAGPGLGAALARRCAADGADVVVAARTQATLEQIADDVRGHGRRALPVATDVVDREQVRALARAAHDEFAASTSSSTPRFLRHRAAILLASASLLSTSLGLIARP